MDYGGTPGLNANIFNFSVSEAYDDASGYSLDEVHTRCLSSNDMRNCFHVFASSTGPTHLLMACGRRGCSRFRTSAGARSWLLGYKLLLISRYPSRPVSLSFDLWAFRTLTAITVGDHLQRLTSRIGYWHGIEDVHQDDVVWTKIRLTADDYHLKKFWTLLGSDVLRLEGHDHLCHGVFSQ